MVHGLPYIEEKQDVCKGCAFGKQHRQSFPEGVSCRAKRKLELVHTDVCGPMDTPSHAQNRYHTLYRLLYPHNLGLFHETKIRSIFCVQEVQKSCRKTKWLFHQNFEK